MIIIVIGIIVSWLFSVEMALPIDAYAAPLERKEMTKVTEVARNLLGAEKSPYLLQHKDNPVNWYPWGDEAFAAAKRDNKPIFLSIGYSTCYWCHVMEKDSFEQQDVAEVLNRDFIAIKVDREEHPDVDKIYMDAVVAISGHGGWPMSVFLTPDRKPFFGGTFFWRLQFLQLLGRINELWRDERGKIRESAEQLTTILAEYEPGSSSAALGIDAFKHAYHQLLQGFDPVSGGFGPAPKFPRSETLALLLRVYRRTDEKQALEMVNITLERMARGGIFDHLGGGFHRYATDSKWLVPHFEKMLYDNALLSVVYLEAFQVTGTRLYAAVAQETLDYILREMRDKEGGFFSAEDAGEVGKEGEFYVWSYDELKQLLTPAELGKLELVYGVTSSGNFEHNNILNLQQSFGWEIKQDSLVVSAHRKLFAQREHRLPPHKDDKVLTAWNALMISGLVKGYRVLGEARYLDAAIAAARFIQSKLYRDGVLLRRYRDGEARFAGYLDDYAFMVQALLDLYESTFDKTWIDWAEELQLREDRLFWDAQNGGYFHSSADEKSLVVRKKELIDGAMPPGNAVSSLNLLRLYGLTAKGGYLEQARQAMQSAAGELARYPSGFCATLRALDYVLDDSKEVVVVGNSLAPEWKEMLRYLNLTFLPNQVIAFADTAKLGDEKALALFRGKQVLEDKVTFYVCSNHTCQAPTTDIAKAKELVMALKGYVIQ